MWRQLWFEYLSLKCRFQTPVLATSTGVCHICCTGSTFHIKYKLNVTVHSCLLEKAPRYLIDCYTPVSEVAGRRQLRSASRQHLTVPPRYRLSTFGRFRAFSVAGPTSWNSLPDRLRDPALSSDGFRGNCLKRGIICELLNTPSKVAMLHDSALYINSRPTMTLTFIDWLIYGGHGPATGMRVRVFCWSESMVIHLTLTDCAAWNTSVMVIDVGDPAAKWRTWRLSILNTGTSSRPSCDSQ